MSEREDLHAQIAQRLFGWVATPVRWDPQDPRRTVWTVPQGRTSWILPAYTTDLAATALVWQWLETQRGPDDWSIAFGYGLGKVSCRIAKWNMVYTLAHEDGATWQEALCRAALALALALAGEGER